MAGIKDLRPAANIHVLVGATILGFVLMVWLSQSTLNRVKVKDPVYDSMPEGKALDSNVLPPSLYLAKARLHIWNLLTEKDLSRLATRIEEYRSDVRDFHDTHDRYEENFAEGPVKQMFRGAAYTEGLAWIDLMDQKLIPAKLGGDDRLAHSVFDQAEETFATHREAMIALADAVEKENKAKVEAAAQAERGIRRIKPAKQAAR